MKMKIYEVGILMLKVSMKIDVKMRSGYKYLD